MLWIFISSRFFWWVGHNWNFYTYYIYNKSRLTKSWYVGNKSCVEFFTLTKCWWMKSLGGIDRESLIPDSAGIYHGRKCSKEWRQKVRAIWLSNWMIKREQTSCGNSGVLFGVLSYISIEQFYHYLKGLAIRRYYRTDNLISGIAGCVFQGLEWFLL